MEAMLGISLYSYSYLNQQKCFVFIIGHVYFSISGEKGRMGSAGKLGGGGRGREKSKIKYKLPRPEKDCAFSPYPMATSTADNG
jgi:hypothetical protein